MSRDLIAAALNCAARGWHVFPITPRGKYPLRGFTAWEQHATTNPDVIARFWERRPCNIGVACGPSRLVVVDLDLPKPGEHPPADAAERGLTTGEDVFRHLCERHGQPYPADTFTVTTRRDGRHLYFTAPPGVTLGNTSGEKGNGLGRLIDTRGRGGYVVGPGSFVSLPDGTGTYTITNPTPPAPLPAWLASLLATPPTTAAPPASTRPRLADLDHARLSRYGRAALTGEVERVAGAPVGGRNRALNLAAWKLGKLIARGVLPRELVEHALTDAAEAANAHGDPNSPREIAAVIAAGLTAGMRT
ncbi:bifunctional DNA primase/polymerase [Microbispora sp. RL4-1S]|uniref:Bifunctional DNA primase/polymerase n=1 Tax=Microbispora oryzae TaxID=2806554 RepID=A0A940WVL9_9ACTN|nr:bifunctional DNA primase/polymerase [Microbispora oryzae]MBP2708210.1 bifunctional DNA primase/polymerase [Microbispora oryzae]